VKEYLLGSEAKFDEGNASCLIAESCLGYLLQFTALGSLNKQNIGHFNLAQYAAQCWIYHARDAEKSDRQSVVMRKLIDDLLNSGGATFVTWIQLWDPDMPWRGVTFAIMPNASSLYYASLCGLFHQIHGIIEKGADVNEQGGRHGNALQAASVNGHLDIVKLLIEMGADVNVQGGFYGTALQAASSGGHKEVLKLLAESGADVNAQGGVYGNALQAASVNGYQGIVKLLAESGADVNAQGGVYDSALQAASVNGHQHIVKLLIEKGAYVHVQGEFSGYVLQAASHQKIIDHPPDFTTATPIYQSNDTYLSHFLLGAKGALKHMKEKDVEIKATFSYWEISEFDYSIHAGFNESLINLGVGYLQEIHVFTSVEIPADSPLVIKLGKLFSPYPGIIFAQASSLQTPVFKDNGTTWDFDELVLSQAK
jgi:Ankyrin repeats (3 copies)